LYIAGFGTYGSVQVLTSVDDWSTALMHTAYSANCGGGGTSAITTLAIVNDRDVINFCANNFGPALYNVSVLSDIVGRESTGMQLSSTIDIMTQYPEGIEYDPHSQRILLSSRYDGSIRSFPASTTGSPTYTVDDSHLIAAGTTEVFISFQ
jgi:hypothetical protein